MRTGPVVEPIETRRRDLGRGVYRVPCAGLGCPHERPPSSAVAAVLNFGLEGKKIQFKNYF